MNIILGNTYADKITGFKGVATGHCEYITGCAQTLLQPVSEDTTKSPRAAGLTISASIMSLRRLRSLSITARRLDATSPRLSVKASVTRHLCHLRDKPGATAPRLTGKTGYLTQSY